MDDHIASFVGITGASPDAAEQILDMCNGDVGQAIQLWFTDEELQRNLSNPAPSASAGTSAAAPTSHNRPSRPSAGRQDSSGVIHIDSDEDDVQIAEEDSDMMDIVEPGAPSGATQAASVAQTAQEEEDAAMAKRLQEELYQGQAAATDEDGVRAPMARTTETLVAPSGPWSMDNDTDDMHIIFQNEMRRRNQLARSHNHNPFAQSIWDDPSNPPPPSSTTTGQSSRAQRLAELFRPPYDLMSHLPWDDARDLGKEDKKWILVNLQDMTDFNCQALNRDIWKDGAIQQLISESFIFLQYAKGDSQADQYVTFYMPSGMQDNPNNFPHVSIVDPRTGEQVKVWSGLPFPSAPDFHAELVEFLDRYSLAANSKNPVVRSKRPERTVDVGRMTEEEMLEMAMKNSLETNGDSRPSVFDPDSLTKSTGGGKGKGKAPATAAGEEEEEEEVEVVEDEEAESSGAAAAPRRQEQETSAFSRIPSNSPHTEPAADPATTTRIQFRHPTGRVIRRFSLQETVQRIYEWLKAEPLEGRDGVEFELKVVPQGRDLIQDLDKTIVEAGLKQATVMIEFIEG